MSEPKIIYTRVGWMVAREQHDLTGGSLSLWSAAGWRIDDALAVLKRLLTE